MSVADHQPLSVVIAAMLVELDILDQLILDRRLKQLPCAFLHGGGKELPDPEEDRYAYRSEKSLV
jgi:hypothetical protein